MIVGQPGAGLATVRVFLFFLGDKWWVRGRIIFLNKWWVRVEKSTVWRGSFLGENNFFPPIMGLMWDGSGEISRCYDGGENFGGIFVCLHFPLLGVEV